MIRWRHARYCWVPCEASGTLQGAPYDDRALLTYLAKLADARGRIELGSPDAVRGLTLLCAVHPVERRAFREVVLRVVATRRVIHEGTRLTLPDYPAWQKSREPSRRLYATESPAFARLPAFARFYAAEMVRAADDEGRVHDGDANAYAHHHAFVATTAARDNVKKRHQARILGGLAALVVEGFLSADGHVRNFAAAQARRATVLAPERTEEARTEGTAQECPSGTAQECPSGTEAGQTHDSSADPTVTRPGPDRDPTVTRPGPDRDPTVTRPGPDPDPTRTRPGPDPDPTVTRPGPDRDPTVTRPYDVTYRNDSSHVGEKGPLPTLPSPTLPSQKQYPAEVSETPSAPEVATAPSPIIEEVVKAPRQGVLFAELDTAAPTAEAKAPQKPSKGRKGGKSAEAMPFTVEAALLTLQGTSNGRFVAGEAATWMKSVFITVTAHIRAFHDLRRWQVLGAWLAAGGDDFKGVLGPAWAASGALRDAMVRAEAWDTAGRGDPSRVNHRPVEARITRTTSPSRVVAFESHAAVVVNVDPLRDLQQRGVG